MKKTSDYYGKAHQTRLSSVRPQGWLREMLLCEKNGMCGHLHEIGYPYNTGCWGMKSLTEGGWSEWWPYEQTGYWIDSMVRTAVLLEDRTLYETFREQIEQALENAEEDGFIGARELKVPGKRNQWPHAVFFRALTALWSESGDTKYLEAMTRHYKTGTCDYTCFREVVNVESMLNIYEVTGDTQLLKLAKSAYDGFCRQYPDNDSAMPELLSDHVPNQHGVTYNEQCKLGAILYMHTGDRQYLEAAVHGYEKLQKYHMLPDGVNSSCEFTLGNDSYKAHETCDIADFSWSMGYMLMATGDGKYADRLEKAVFNAAPGAIGPYFNTIQYFSAVNQVIAARNSTFIDSFGDTPRFAYQPHHYPECCVGNVGRIFPAYIARMYLETDKGLYLALYGDSRYSSEDFTVTQSGGYPFSDKINIVIRCREQTEKTLFFRIPSWCRKYRLEINGEPVQVAPEKGFAAVNRVWQDADEATLRFETEPASQTTCDGGRYFTYGSFLLALPIDECWEKDQLEKRQTEKFPAYNVYPKSKWNYAVPDDAVNRAVFKRGTVGANPFWDSVPFSVEIPARELQGWDIVRRSITKTADAEEQIDDKMVALGATQITGTLELTPPLPEHVDKAKLSKETVIKLVPYGCTNLRVSVFPQYRQENPNPPETA